MVDFIPTPSTPQAPKFTAKNFNPASFTVNGANAFVTGPDSTNTPPPAPTTPKTSSTSSAPVLSPAVVALLQQAEAFANGFTQLGASNNNVSDTLNAILGNNTPSKDTTALGMLGSAATQYANALKTAANTAAASSVTNYDPLQGILDAYHTAMNAYNQTVAQNIQAVITANSFGADGVTPLVV